MVVVPEQWATANDADISSSFMVIIILSRERL